LGSILNFFSPFIQPDPETALLVVLNLILVESLLSLDNAAVLATIVMKLPEGERKRALRIGTVFAYIFRGIALISANLLIKINWLKLLGGGYLLYLFFDFFYSRIFKKEPVAELDEEVAKARRKAARKIPGLNFFWSTVVMVELMDLTFSIDNVFAAVAFTKNIYLICTGVFIGIITMRIVAGYFVKLMNIFPFLESVAFTIIGVLGARLCLDFACTYFPDSSFCNLIRGSQADFRFSMLTVIIFFLPILTSLVFNFPKRKI
jgi:YkoY family integral membrane protein